MDGQFSEALELYEIQSAGHERDSALWTHNVGVLKYLTGNSDEGTALLRKALDAALVKEKDELSAYCMMVLNKELDSVSSIGGLAVDAGILINLCLVGDLKREHVVDRLTERYADKIDDWVALLPADV